MPLFLRCPRLAPVSLHASASALVLVLLRQHPSEAQQEGFITTRVDCVPGVQETINYLQGPDPIRTSEGDIHLFVDASDCCDGSWEGIFNLHYPAATVPATPRFFPLWASNDFGTQTERGEHEAPFPSLFEASGSWHIAYTSTFFPTSQPNRDRLARLDLSSPFARVSPRAVDNSWIEPVDPNCRPIGSCSGTGPGVLGTAVRHADGSLYLYHPDGNYPACSSGWIRHQVFEDLTLFNPNGDDGCLSFSGMPTAPTFISDIAIDSGNLLHMLVGHNDSITSIEEWTSFDGLSWTHVEDPWHAPSHPMASEGWVYSVWNAGFLKNDQRVIEYPRVLVAQISEGRTFDEIVDASLGRWHLYYWAEQNANLPPHFAQAAHACNTFQGHVDGLSCDGFNGWAWDSAYPNSPISVELFDGANRVLTLPASHFRQDLLDAGIGNGFHAFVSELPIQLFDGEEHVLQARYVHTDLLLTDGQSSLTCSALLIFSDGFESGDTSAWS